MMLILIIGRQAMTQDSKCFIDIIMHAQLETGSSHSLQQPGRIPAARERGCGLAAVDDEKNLFLTACIIMSG